MVEMYGLGAWVAHCSGLMVPAVNLDNAATTPPFADVAREVQQQMLHYGSIGRGVGQKSKHSSMVYEKGRKAILDFLGADEDEYTVFYTSNTTDGMNKLAGALTGGSDEVLVVSTRMEHHANDLPWRGRAHMAYAEVDADGRLILDDFARILRRHEYSRMTKYVTVTAASNVTGYINDVHSIAQVAHKYGAKIIVDGAQIVAHRPFAMHGTDKNEDIDFFVFSAHKMYSPFGAGAVVGRKDLLNSHLPQFCGGGMVETVTDDAVVYAKAPDLYEAGSPGVPGVVGMLKSIEILQNIGFENIIKHEQKLLRRALDGLSKIRNIALYGDNTNIADRVGILVFNIEGRQPIDIANELAGRAGIAVRHAAFCAHPYVRRLEGKAPHELCGQAEAPRGMVRASFGIYNTEADVDLLVQTVKEIAADSEVRISECPPWDEHTKTPNDRA